MPAIEVTYLGPRGDVRTARTAPLTMKIDSLIANEPEPALKDAAPPVTVMRGEPLAGLHRRRLGGRRRWARW